MSGDYQGFIVYVQVYDEGCEWKSYGKYFRIIGL